MKKILTWVLKLAFSLGVLGVLAWKAQHDGSFSDLVKHDKNWLLLAASGVAMLATLVIQFLRWRLLARALDLQLTPSEAVRLGFMAQLFSLIGVGMLGGDALKTYFLGRQNRGRTAEALTSVFFDRVIGLYGLIVMAGIACLFFDTENITADSEAERAAFQTLCRIVPWVALIGTLAFVVLLVPATMRWAGWDRLAKIPRLGRPLEKLIGALRMYGRAPIPLVTAIGMSLLIHVLNTLAFYWVSLALPAYTLDGIAVAKPSLLAHATAALLALATGALPIGALEVVFNIAYRSVSSPAMPPQQGFLIVLAYRLLQMCIAVIGLYYYLAGRREVDQLLEAAQRDQDRKSGAFESAS